MTSAEPCGLCGQAAAVPLYGFEGPPRFEVRFCPHCQVGLTLPQLDFERIAEHYPQAYYGSGGRKFNGLIESLVYLSRLRRAQRIVRYVPSGRILDVGCGGRPHFLELMRERGWEVHGNERTEFPELRRLESSGVKIQVCDFLEADYPPGHFDVIVLWHVLEHMRDPGGTLEKLRDLLRPGGMLVLALPNLSSLQARWTGAAWFHLDIPRHYFHFTREGLSRLLRERGFSIHYVSLFSLEQDLFSWTQSLYNRLGFDHNLLYNLLRTRSAKMYEGGSRFLQVLLLLLLLPAVGGAAVVLFLLEIALGRGGCMEIYAWRR